MTTQHKDTNLDLIDLQKQAQAENSIFITWETVGARRYPDHSPSNFLLDGAPVRPGTALIHVPPSTPPIDLAVVQAEFDKAFLAAYGAGPSPRLCRALGIAKALFEHGEEESLKAAMEVVIKHSAEGPFTPLQVGQLRLLVIDT